MKYFISLSIIVFFFSCSNEENTKSHNNPIKKNSDSVEVEIDTLAKSDNAEPCDFPDSLFTFQIYNDSLYPIQLLFVGHHHSDEVDEKLIKQKWIGIFKNSNGFYLKETSIISHRVQDIADEGNEKTGWNISTPQKDSCLYLIYKGKFLREGAIKTISTIESLAIGDSINLKFDDKKYTLVNKKLCAFKSILLFKSANKIDTLDYLISGEKNLQILLIGDFDRDGKLDLLIDLSDQENLYYPSLFLSSPAYKGKLLKKVAVHTSVGC